MTNVARGVVKLSYSAVSGIDFPLVSCMRANAGVQNTVNMRNEFLMQDWNYAGVVNNWANTSWYFRVIEFRSYQEMERAYRHLNGMDINGKKIKLEIVSIQPICDNCFLGKYWKTLTWTVSSVLYRWKGIMFLEFPKVLAQSPLTMKPLDAAWTWQRSMWFELSQPIVFITRCMVLFAYIQCGNLQRRNFLITNDGYIYI